MIDKIATALMTSLADDVNFMDVWTGLVRPMRKQVQNRERIFPVAINTSQACDTSDYMALVPDSKKKSIAYVEKTGNTVVDIDRPNYRFLTDTLKLVFWYNLDLIAESKYVAESEMSSRVLAYMPKTLYDMLQYGVKKIIVSVDSVEYGADVLSQYTYDEIKTQYGTFPYGIFAINVSVSYVMINCIIPVGIDEGCGAGKGDLEQYTLPLTADLINFEGDTTETTADSTQYIA